MFIAGKFFGAFFGLLFYGPVGLVMGVLFGHFFDKGLKLNVQVLQQDPAVVKNLFFKTTFMVMGYIAKVDGRVSEEEIKIAREAMVHLQLNAEQKTAAIAYFNMGKSPSFHLTGVLDHFIQYCGHYPQLVQIFVEMQLRSVFVEGLDNRLKRQVLEILCDKLGVPRAIITQMERQYRYRGSTQSQRDPPRTHTDALADAYKEMALASSVSNEQLKQTYRKLMSQHHPDKLVARGLPESMIKVATEKVQRIQAAYTVICQARGL